MFLLDKLKSYDLILGSRSPRRSQLLQDCDLRFTVADGYEVEESFPADLPVEEVAPYLSRLKSEGYPLALAPSQILLTADTTVITEGQILGKPADRKAAKAMLQQLSGRSHQVLTGVTLRTARHRDTFTASTTVFFKPLSDEEIHYYIEHYRPYDKAGAYGIQEWIGCVGIERIEGSFYNVMGLPVQLVLRHLESLLSDPVSGN
ncbi:MAG: Maf family nucleotide pyrophosphatase [Alistipes sp.]|nr:Maf family nucleotide pyrophosphatase [Alistipes sp.]